MARRRFPGTGQGVAIGPSAGLFGASAAICGDLVQFLVISGRFSGGLTWLGGYEILKADKLTC